VTFSYGKNLTWTSIGNDTYTTTYAGLGSYFVGASAGWSLHVLNDRMCTCANSLADVTSPPAQLTSNGHLLINLLYYDSGTGLITFRSANPTGSAAQVTSPNTQLFLVLASVQFAFNEGSYVTFQGLDTANTIDFRYALDVHLTVATEVDFMTDAAHFTNQNFRYCRLIGFGLVGAGIGNTFDNLLIDLVAPAYDGYSGGTYTHSALAWGLYISGVGITVQNCIFARNTCGGAIQAYPYGVTNGIFRNNVEYGNSSFSNITLN